MSTLELEKLKLNIIIICDPEMRYNPNHDPKTGKFAPGHGSSSGGKTIGSGYGKSTNGTAYKKADNSTQAQHKNAIATLADDKYPDYKTYDMDTLEIINYDSGFQVTFCQIGDDYSSSEYADKVNEFLAISFDGKVCAGKYEGTPEVSFNVTDKETAIKLAEKYNQISIWDWYEGNRSNNGEIYIGGTGRRKKGGK